MKNAAKPNPIRPPSLSVLDDPIAARQLHCRHYDDCLDVAQANGWPGFGCSACSGFEPLSPQGEARDHRGLLELLAELGLVDIWAAEKAA